MDNVELKQENWLLSELMKKLVIEKTINFTETEIKYVTNNSKKTVPGSLFVAIEGFKTNGHQYISEAIENGAVAIVGEEYHQISADIPYIRVQNSRKALAKLATKFYSFPSQSMRLVGVTGTAGKTTTTAMVDKIANQVVHQTGLIGTLHTKIGDETYSNPQDCTTPNAVVLNERLAQMQQTGIDYVSMEVSSHALKLDRVWGLDYDIGIFTNLSYDHLNFHQSIEDYYSSKAKLFTELKESGVAIFNQDDNYTEALIEEIDNTYYTYGINQPADITAEQINLTKQGMEFKVNLNNRLQTLTEEIISPTETNLKLSILGYHNVYNALAAFTAGLVLGFDLADIKQGLEKFQGIRRRMDLIYDQEFTIIDDFAHNLASLTANFRTITELNYDKLVIVHFLKGNRGTEANKLNAQLIARWKEELDLKEIITTKCAKKVIDKNKVLPAEEEIFQETIIQNNIKISGFEALNSALKAGLEKVSDNDLLLIVGGPGLDEGRRIINKLLD